MSVETGMLPAWMAGSLTLAARRGGGGGGAGTETATMPAVLVAVGGGGGGEKFVGYYGPTPDPGTF